MAHFQIFLSRPELLITTAAFSLLAAYHLHSVYCIRRYPMTTAVGITNHVRRKWVEIVMHEKRDIMAVQILRNLVMAASFLASTAVLVNLGLLGAEFRPGVYSDISRALNLSGAPIDFDPHYSAGKVEKDDVK